MRNPTPDFTGMDPSQAGQALIGWAEQLQCRAQTYRSLHHQMSQLAVTETSADGMVRVSVDAQGVPTEMTLTDRARGADPARLSAELMTCLRRAQRTLAAQVQDLVTASVQASGDAAAAQIMTSYRNRFLDLPEDAPARHARRTHPPDDDDLNQSSPR
ncbi:MAG: YbaB/EbfC family nucleoid-associated protein [Pseudonocardiales bacterium]|nr:YbaB/EbfC family nucleoid-associated protein [Pseudonocardiales bacterium]MBV9730323.1 YbaB/EbfC family nucleoid-associated protein [Pseudonocardiales bacterium]